MISVRICLKNRRAEKEAVAAANDKDVDSDGVDILSPRITALSSVTAAAPAARTPVGIRNPTTPAVPVQVQVSKSKPEFTL